MAESDRLWTVHDVEFEGDAADPNRASSPWSGHRWFAYDLIRWWQPTTIVELGTHFGCSFFSFCQAARDGGIHTRLHAVDTWAGDPHAGLYGEEVFEQFTSVLSRLFGDLDTHLHRMLFDNALGSFDDESIELIHIDGFHSYEATSHDYTTWLPKLKPNGIILLHDVAASSGYGSARFWDELKERHPSIEFPHNFGLGVIMPKGTDGLETLLGGEFTRWKSWYTHRADAHLGRLQYHDQTRMITERDEALTAQAALIDERDRALTAQAALIDERDRALTAQAALIDEHHDRLASVAARLETLEESVLSKALIIEDQREAIAAQAAMIDDRDAAIAVQTSMIDERDQMIRGQAAAISERDATIAHLEQPALWRLLRSSKTLTKRAARRLPSPLRRPLVALRKRYWRLRASRSSRERRRLAQRRIEGSRTEGGATAPSIPVEAVRSVIDVDFYRAFGDDIHIDPAKHYATIGFLQARPATRSSLRPLQPTSTVDPGGWMVPTLHQPNLSPRRLASVVEAVRQGYRLLTFDFFDTLALRRRPPECSKLDTAQQLACRLGDLGTPVSVWDLYNRRIDIEAETAAARATHAGVGEYNAEEVLSRVLAELIDQDLADRLARQAVSDEAAREPQHLERAPMVDWLLEAEAIPGVRVAIVSDFYLGEEHLSSLVSALDERLAAVPIFVSADHGVSKASGGELHRLVRDALDVQAGAHLHFGDSDHADISMQLSTGGSAAHVVLPPWSRTFPEAGRLTPGVLAMTALNMHRLAGAPPTVEEDGIRSYDDLATVRRGQAFEAGALLGLPLASLAEIAFRNAKDRDADEIAFTGPAARSLRRVFQVLDARDHDLSIVEIPQPFATRVTTVGSTVVVALTPPPSAASPPRGGVATVTLGGPATVVEAIEQILSHGERHPVFGDFLGTFERGARFGAARAETLARQLGWEAVHAAATLALETVERSPLPGFADAWVLASASQPDSPIREIVDAIGNASPWPARRDPWLEASPIVAQLRAVFSNT